MIKMKENLSTLIAVGGVVAIIAGVIFYSAITGQTLDSELVKQAIAGLIGFAAGGITTTSKPV